MSRPIFLSECKSIEWIMCFFALGWAITLAMPGDTFTINSYSAFNKFGLKEDNLIIFYFSIAIIRMYALYTNGSLKRGPEIRFVCSVVCAFTWLCTAGLFALPYFQWHTTSLPVNFSHHLIMFFGELYAVGVASLDRRSKR